MYLLALTLGLGCGAGCGSVVTPFMTSYVIGKQQNRKESFKSILAFSLGKIWIMMVLGALTALIGQNIMDIMGAGFPFQLTHLFNGIMIIFGLHLIYANLKKRKCCSSCKEQSIQIDGTSTGYNVKTKKEYAALFISGVLYGLTPCAPLGIMLVTAIGTGIVNGMLLLGFFGLVTCVSPALIQVLIAGIMMPKMKSEIPEKMHWITMASGCIMVALGAMPLVRSLFNI